VPVRRMLQKVPAGGGLELMITVWVPKMTSRVTFGTQTVIMTVAPPRCGPPPPEGETLFARASPHRPLSQRPVGGVMGVRTTRAGGTQAGRRADGGSPPASAVSIDVHDLLQEVWDRWTTQWRQHQNLPPGGNPVHPNLQDRMLRLAELGDYCDARATATPGLAT
jgi:hypothetical protein